jgi:hypothetical protein
MDKQRRPSEPIRIHPGPSQRPKPPPPDQCAACGRDTHWSPRTLRVASEEEHFPPNAIPLGGFNDHIDGYFPLCSTCILQCTTCKRPVTTLPVDRLVERLRSGEHAHWLTLTWFPEPCQNISHDRPAREVHRQPPTRPSGRPEPPKTIPGWSCTYERLGICGVGDRVTVGDLAQVGTVLYLWACKLSGGAIATVEFDDGSWTRVRIGQVQRVDDASTHEAD